MKKFKIFLVVFALGLIGVYAFNVKIPVSKLKKSSKVSSTDSFMDGDLIFQTNTAGQGLAIQLATHSEFTHIAMLFKQGDEWMVYEAVEPVQVVSLDEFASHGEGGKYVVIRLKNRDSLLNSVKLKLMKDYMDKQLNKHYDIHFGWDNDRLYCSELVWKCYKKAGIEIGPLKKLKEFDLTSPVVKKIMAERYGKNIPYDEKVISPGDIFTNTALREVYRN